MGIPEKECRTFLDCIEAKLAENKEVYKNTGDTSHKQYLAGYSTELINLWHDINGRRQSAGYSYYLPQKAAEIKRAFKLP